MYFLAFLLPLVAISAEDAKCLPALPAPYCQPDCRFVRCFEIQPLDCYRNHLFYLPADRELCRCCPHCVRRRVDLCVPHCPVCTVDCIDINPEICESRNKTYVPANHQYPICKCCPSCK